MESKKRTVAKAVTWQGLGLITTTAIVWAASGSLAAALSAAGGTAASSFVFYIIHERVWAAVAWGRSAHVVAEERAAPDGALEPGVSQI